ncbi:MAG: peptidoglycan-binding domain-containing protein [Candidatus Pacebacteria bacterium]|nr:peptidoglycan-binding domain-containing protein [Candidatus Paceibacterota bacterium]
MKTTNTKKFGFIIGLAFVLIMLASSAFAACSLQNLGICDRKGLLTIIIQLLSARQGQPQSAESGTNTAANSVISGIPAGFQFSTDMKEGSTGSEVKYLQILLNSDKDTSLGNAGKETSYFGTATKAAVIKFQKKYAPEILAPAETATATGLWGSFSRAKANNILGHSSAPTKSATCTSWTYSSWSTCSASGQQTRTVLSSFPKKCVNGNPIVSQSCTPALPNPTPPTCTSWVYSNWSACSSNGQQTRTVLSSSPSGCINGNPVISQSCTPPPITCTSWTYSSWGACSANGQQTRSVISSSPSGCVNGNPIITQSCTPPAPTTNEVFIAKAYTTAYTWFDNTPPGSSDIALPVLHQQADGIGTYADPITIAVGHVISGGNDTPDYPAGTRFYIPNLRAYFIVEDLCGDGNTPQNIPCHNLSEADSGATTWIDMWIDGQSGTRTTTDNCAEDITGLHLAIKNPLPNYAVITGPIFQNGQCREQFGDNLVIE